MAVLPVATGTPERAARRGRERLNAASRVGCAARAPVPRRVEAGSRGGGRPGRRRTVADVRRKPANWVTIVGGLTGEPRPQGRRVARRGHDGVGSRARDPPPLRAGFTKSGSE